MRKTRFLLAGLALVLSGCATTANYEAILKTWMGVHADRLVASWGPPQNSFQLSGGGQVLEYVFSRDVQLGGYSYTTPQTTVHSGSVSAYGTGGSAYGTYSGTSTTYVQKQTPTYNVNTWCKTRFTTNSSGIIERWAWQGNNCRAMSPK